MYVQELSSLLIFFPFLSLCGHIYSIYIVNHFKINWENWFDLTTLSMIDPGSSLDMPGDRTQEGAHGNWKRAIFGFSGLARKHELTISVESLPRVTVTNSGGCQTPAPGRKVTGILTPIRRMFEPLGTGAGSQFYPAPPPPPDGCSWHPVFPAATLSTVWTPSEPLPLMPGRGQSGNASPVCPPALASPNHDLKPTRICFLWDLGRSI